MELLKKLEILADAAKYDASCSSSGSDRKTAAGTKHGIGSTEGMGICHAYAPDGRCISLLKILLTNFCVYDCLYCVNRRSSNVRRARFTPEEVVDLTLGFYRRNYIEGLFLSSGIIRSPDYTMEQIIQVARTLREQHGFRGYIHLKTIPDASPELLAEAGRHADRLSINIELPVETSLGRLAPEKDGAAIRRSMGRLRLNIEQAKEEPKGPRFAPGGQSTQMIVGADATDDKGILATSDRLYNAYRLRRVYYSAFSPIPDSSSGLPPRAPPLMREHRLYQADWLMRFYSFEAVEIVPDGGLLDLEIDPKLAWALANRQRFPVDVNKADARPEAVDWRVGGDAGLFSRAEPVERVAVSGRGFSVPRGFMDLVESVVCHRDPARFAVLYSLLWRLTHGETGLLEIVSDREVYRAEAMARAVRRDIHKMHAFVRFRERDGHYLAWFEPDHFIVDQAAPFFARRFANMHWSILTPDRSAHWDGERLHLTAGASRRDVPDDDALEEYWRSYYASIFNPARLKVAAMQAEMPRKYWHNLPEARMIAPLIRSAGERAAGMIEAKGTAAPLKASRWAEARVADHSPVDDDGNGDLQGCRRCGLWKCATQAVPGEGPLGAALMLVGEQPGDQEDLAGKAFVGPAGRLLDRAMKEAGIERSKCYVTNAVKHFKFTPRGKRRIHQSPDAGEIEHCRWWLTREIAAVRPRLIVALGATAGRSLLRRPVAVQRERGTVLTTGSDYRVLLTVHPSFLLRLPDAEQKALEYERFVADLRLAASSM